MNLVIVKKDKRILFEFYKAYIKGISKKLSNFNNDKNLKKNIKKPCLNTLNS